LTSTIHPAHGRARRRGTWMNMIFNRGALLVVIPAQRRCHRRARPQNSASVRAGQPRPGTAGRRGSIEHGRIGEFPTWLLFSRAGAAKQWTEGNTKRFPIYNNMETGTLFSPGLEAHSRARRTSLFPARTAAPRPAATVPSTNREQGHGTGAARKGGMNRPSGR